MYKKQERTKTNKANEKTKKLKTKTKMEWNPIGIRYENHEKKKVTHYGQRHRTKRLG